MTASARGLFRATGKTAKAVPVQLLDGSFTKGEAPREADDFYPTPPEPTRAFLSVEGSILRQLGAWEPAAGDGAMVRELEALGIPVFASDIIDRGCGAEIRSFYDYSSAPRRAIITNPPFAECNKDPGWIRHALEQLRIEYMALLLPVNWLGAVGRAALWARFPPSRIYVMRWRIDFTGQGAPPMLNAWFVWDNASRGETVLRMLDRTDARQLSMLGDSP
jgi:hypothetical protein